MMKPCAKHDVDAQLPHLGYVTRNTYEPFYREAVEDIQAWLRGVPVRVPDGTE